MNNRRKNYFIKKKFQANFFIKFFVLLVAEAFLIAALFMVIAEGTLTTAYTEAGLTIQRTGSYFLLSFILISTVVGLGIGIAGIFVFMYLSHRIGGPLYKFEKTVEAAQSGDIAQRVTLRKTDQLLEIRDLMNEFLRDLDKRLAEIKNDFNDLKLATERDLDPENVRNINETIKKIESSLGHFNTSE